MRFSRHCVRHRNGWTNCWPGIRASSADSPNFEYPAPESGCLILYSITSEYDLLPQPYIRMHYIHRLYIHVRVQWWSSSWTRRQASSLWWTFAWKEHMKNVMQLSNEDKCLDLRKVNMLQANEANSIKNYWLWGYWTNWPWWLPGDHDKIWSWSLPDEHVAQWIIVSQLHVMKLPHHAPGTGKRWWLRHNTFWLLSQEACLTVGSVHAHRASVLHSFFSSKKSLLQDLLPVDNVFSTTFTYMLLFPR